MPELPEVQTVVDDLNKKLRGRWIVAVWSDGSVTVRDFKNQRDKAKGVGAFKIFSKEVLGKKVLGVTRRAKNILIDFEDVYLMLVHLKMTGHFLFGDWNNALERKKQHIRLVFDLDNGMQLAFSDMRKFGKVLWGRRGEIMALPEIAELGPEPLGEAFTAIVFAERLQGRNGKIKQVLMDPKRVAGIGNIYADEVLWAAKISPTKRARSLAIKEVRALHKAIVNILARAVELRGTSMRDYRDTSGEKGGYYQVVNAYGRDGLPCKRCKALLKRIMLGGRSAHFCPQCQPQVY